MRVSERRTGRYGKRRREPAGFASRVNVKLARVRWTRYGSEVWIGRKERNEAVRA